MSGKILCFKMKLDVPSCSNLPLQTKETRVHHVKQELKDESLCLEIVENEKIIDEQRIHLQEAFFSK